MNEDNELTVCLSVPHIKHTFFMSSSITAASSLSPANVSMMIPNIMLKKRRMIIIMNDKSLIDLSKYTSFDSLYQEVEGRLSPIPPPLRKPKFNVDM